MAGSITVELGTGVTSFSYAWENTNGNRTPTGTGTKTTTSSIYCNNCDHIYITNVTFESGYGPSFSFGGSTSTTYITFYPPGSGTYTVKGVKNSTPTTYTTHSVRISSTGVTANIWYYDKNNNYQTATLQAGGTLAFNARSGTNYAGATNIRYVNGYTTPITWNYNDSSGNNRQTQISNGGNNSIDTTYNRGIQINATKQASTTYTVYVQKDSHTGYASVSYGSTSSENYVSGVPYNGQVTFLAKNFSTGYEFSHWADTNGKLKSTDNPWKPNIQANFTAKAISKQIATNTIEKLAFDKNTVATVSNMPSILSNSNNAIGTTFTIPNNIPTRTDNYSFSHWDKNADDSDQQNFSPGGTIYVDSGQTEVLYAIWKQLTPRKQYLKFVKNTSDDVTNLPDNQSATTYDDNGYTFTIGKKTPLRNNYRFLYWNKQSNGGDQQNFDPEDTIWVKANSTTTLYAQWTPQIYSITAKKYNDTNSSAGITKLYVNYVDEDGKDQTVSGTSSATASGVPYNNSVTLSCDFNSTVYNFDGWYSSSTGSSPVSIDQNYTFTASSAKTYYAKVTKKPTYTVTANICTGEENENGIKSLSIAYGDEEVNGDPPISVTGVLKGDSVTLSCQLNTGYNFLGWYTSSTGITRQSSNRNFTVSPITGNITYYAKVEKTNYSVTLSKTEGISYIAIRYNDDSREIGSNNSTTSITMNQIPKGTSIQLVCTVEEGYTFKEWQYTNTSSRFSNQKLPVFSIDDDYNLQPIAEKQTIITAKMQAGYYNDTDSENGISSITISSGDLSSTVNDKRLATISDVPAGQEVEVRCSIVEGYSFGGWWSSSNTYINSGTGNYHIFTFQAPEVDTILYAKAIKNAPEKVTVAAYCGTGISEVTIYYSDSSEDSGIRSSTSSTKAELSNTPVGTKVTFTCKVKDNYSFNGWYYSNGIPLNDTGTGNNHAVTITIPAENFSLTAKGAQTGFRYQLNFNTNNGSWTGPSALYYPEDSLITTTDTSHTFSIPEKTPIRNGYKFLGWHTNNASTIAIYGGDTGNNTIDLQATKPTVTLYAIWKECKYFTWTASDADDAVQIKQGKPFCITSQKWNDFNKLIKNYLKSSYKPTPVQQEWQFSHLYMRETLTVLQGLTNDPFPGFTDAKDKDTINKNDPVKAIYFTELKTYLNDKLKNL